MHSVARSLVVLAALSAAAPVRAQTPGGPRRLSLSQAVQEASQGAPGVQLAGYQVDMSRAQAGVVRSSLLPSLSASGAWVNRTENLAAFGISGPGLPPFVPPFNNWDARLKLTQTLFDYSGWQRLRAQGYQTAGSVADRSAAAQAAAQGAAAAYLAGARAEALVAARVQDSSVAAQLLSLAQAQLQAGVSAALDVTRARTQLVAAEGDLIVARNQRRKADITLALALGEDPGASYVLADTLTGNLGSSAASEDTAAAFDLARRLRPDLTAEEARGAAAATARRAIATERLPRVDFAADYGPNGMTWPSSRLTQDVAVVVSIPLVDGLGREARGAAQAAAERASDTRADDLRRRIRAQVRAGLLDLETGREQQAVAAQGLALAEEELSEARDRFASGVAGNIDVINAQATLNHARDVEIGARYAIAAARVALAYAAGVADTVH